MFGVTMNRVESFAMDAWPRPAAIVDFGLKTQQHYEALYYPWRRGEITTKQLDTAMGDGQKLTALAQAAPSNPHRNIVFDCGYCRNDDPMDTTT